jgi:hypothetical protein
MRRMTENCVSQEFLAPLSCDLLYSAVLVWTRRAISTIAPDAHLWRTYLTFKSLRNRTQNYQKDMALALYLVAMARLEQCWRRLWSAAGWNAI